jgi:hypothetical protein
VGFLLVAVLATAGYFWLRRSGNRRSAGNTPARVFMICLALGLAVVLVGVQYVGVVAVPIGVLLALIGLITAGFLRRRDTARITAARSVQESDIDFSG